MSATCGVLGVAGTSSGAYDVMVSPTTALVTGIAHKAAFFVPLNTAPTKLILFIVLYT